MAVRRHVQAGQGQRCKQLENKARGGSEIRSERWERHCWLWPDTCTNTITRLSFTPQDAGFLRRSNSGKEPRAGGEDKRRPAYPALHLKRDGGDLQSESKKTFPNASAPSAKL